MDFHARDEFDLVYEPIGVLRSEDIVAVLLVKLQQERLFVIE